MNEMTLDDLRNAGRELLRHHEEVGYVLLAAADAWEADRRALRDSSEQIIPDNDVLASLRQRLEEAERRYKEGKP